MCSPMRMSVSGNLALARSWCGTAQRKTTWIASSPSTCAAFSCASSIWFPVMLKQVGGSIVNTSSSAGLIGFTGQGAYAATKLGIIASRNVPRSIMRNSIFARMPFAPESSTRRRLGKPEEIALAVFWLCSIEGAFTHWKCNGGRWRTERRN